MLCATTPNISSSTRNTPAQPVFPDYFSVFYNYGKRNVEKWRVLTIYESEFYYLNILYWMSHALLRFVSKYIDLHHIIRALTPKYYLITYSSFTCKFNYLNLTIIYMKHFSGFIVSPDPRGPAKGYHFVYFFRKRHYTTDAGRHWPTEGPGNIF